VWRVVDDAATADAKWKDAIPRSNANTVDTTVNARRR